MPAAKTVPGRCMWIDRLTGRLRESGRRIVGGRDQPGGRIVGLVRPRAGIAP